MPLQFFLDEQETEETFAAVGSVFYMIASVIMLIILINYSVKLFQDLFTKERKSVSHRRAAPTITDTYKLIIMLTYVAVFIYFIQVIGGLIGYFSTTDLQCDIKLTWIFVTYQLAKSSMYLVYLTRLYYVYSLNEAFSYPTRCTRFFALILIVCCIVSVTTIISITKAIVKTYGDPNFPNSCLPANKTVNIVVGGIII